MERLYLSRSGIELEKSVIEKRDSLVNALASLESKPDFIEKESLQKTVKIIKDTGETANNMLVKTEVTDLVMS